MNITSKIIIVDTNVITDLSNAQILDKFVMLDNVYISDMIKNDEINNATGDIDTIKKMQVIEFNNEQITEMFKISTIEKGLSPYDIINYIIARDNNAILATGDKKLVSFSKNNEVEVIRTLKIIELMQSKKILSKDEAIKACILLKENNFTRIPSDSIDELIEKIKQNLVNC